MMKVFMHLVLPDEGKKWRKE